NWGDGNTGTGSFTELGGGLFEVTGSHTYGKGQTGPVGVWVSQAWDTVVSTAGQRGWQSPEAKAQARKDAQPLAQRAFIHTCNPRTNPVLVAVFQGRIYSLDQKQLLVDAIAYSKLEEREALATYQQTGSFLPILRFDAVWRARSFFTYVDTAGRIVE